jgi:hypothetical protein
LTSRAGNAFTLSCPRSGESRDDRETGTGLGASWSPFPPMFIGCRTGLTGRREPGMGKREGLRYFTFPKVRRRPRRPHGGYDAHVVELAMDVNHI